MPNSVYYDTCLFLHTRNPAHKESKACARLLPPSIVSWTVCISSEISTGEATIKEFLEQCMVQWTLNGVALKDVKLTESKARAKSATAEKKALHQIGFRGNDFNHLMAALHAGAE